MIARSHDLPCPSRLDVTREPPESIRSDRPDATGPMRPADAAKSQVDELSEKVDRMFKKTMQK